MPQVLVFEDETYKNLFPLTLTKPICELVCGGRRQRERLAEAFSEDDLAFAVREHLAEAYQEKTEVPINTLEKSETTLLINSALTADPETLQSLKTLLDQGEALVSDGTLVAMRAERSVAEKIFARATTGGKLIMNVVRRHATVKNDQKAKLLRYPWDLLRLHKGMLEKDIDQVTQGKTGDVSVDVGSGRVLAHEEASIDRDVFIDARKGGIVIEKSAEIQYPSRITGPAWIGRGSRILSALLREGSRVGPVCKVGGEMEMSVMEEYSNKAHGGYLGHSYVGEWVNIGAMVVTSDLKNTYGSVRMNVRDESMDSQTTKVGGFLADYSKVSISTSIFAGKTIGVASHVSGLVDTDVPSFTLWGLSSDGQAYEVFLESALKTQGRMAARRDRQLTSAEERLMESVFEATRDDRLRKGVKRGKIPS